MTNSEFCEVIEDSFIACQETSPRSNEKLKILHGKISTDIINRIKDFRYEIKSLGFDDGKEYKVNGRYNEKAVDITILKNKQPIAGIAVKFVMSNYSQNSNNYFENMIGETANIRANGIPYYQIFIVLDDIPYYDKSGNIEKWETITGNNISKYVKLSEDDIDSYIHVPNKMLVFIAHIVVSNMINKPRDKEEYKRIYSKGNIAIEISRQNIDFGDTIILNDYEKFAKAVVDEMN